jgi:hypothetical protein
MLVIDNGIFSGCKYNWIVVFVIWNWNCPGTFWFGTKYKTILWVKSERIKTWKALYIITTVKHAIWLVNSRAWSGYPAWEMKMPSRDFRGILKMSLFHCSYFIKQLPNGFPSRIAWSMYLGCCSTFRKRKNTRAAARVFLRFPKVSRHPSCMDHAILRGKPFGIPLMNKQWSSCKNQGPGEQFIYLFKILYTR